MRRHGLAIVGATLALAVLVVPLAALLGRTPWSELPSALRQPDVAQALTLSLWTSLVTAALVIALGTPLALLLSRSTSWLSKLARVVVALPVVLPPVAGGMALLAAFGRRGYVGQFFASSLSFTSAAVIAAQLFVSLPFFVLTLESGLRRDLRELEEAAATMGAGRWQVLRYVTFPLVAPSLAAGTVLAWARAVGEFGATITFAGNLPGVTQTLPLAMYLAVQHDLGLAYVLATLMLGVSGGMMVLSQFRRDGSFF